jgi:hypothetical protein
LSACCRLDGFFIFVPDALVPLSIAASAFDLQALVNAPGGKRMPEEQLGYVRYGAITGGALGNYIHIENSDNWLKK